MGNLKFKVFKDYVSILWLAYQYSEIKVSKSSANFYISLSRRLSIDPF